MSASESTFLREIRRVDAVVPLVLGLGLMLVFSTGNLIESRSLALVGIHPLVEQGLLAGAIVVGIVWIVGPRSIRGPTTLFGGGFGFAVAALGIVVDSYPTAAGYALVIGTALVFLSGIAETTRYFSLPVP